MKDKLKEKLLTEYILNYKESLYRVAYTYTKNREDALDVVQEAICKAFSAIDLLENEKAIKTWMYRIIVTTAIDYLRKNKKYLYVEEQVIEEGEYDQYENIDLKKVLNQLAPQDRMMIILRYFEDLKIKEVATILDENVNTIKTRLYAVLKKMRIEME